MVTASVNLIVNLASWSRRVLRVGVGLFALTPQPLDLSRFPLLERQADFVRIRPAVQAEDGHRYPHLVKENHLVAKAEGGRFVHFLNRIFSRDNLDSGFCPVILLPGILTNSNLFRMPTDGEFEKLDDFKDLDKVTSFANVLAEAGLNLFPVHPPYCDRLYERYVDHVLGVRNASVPTLNFDNLARNLKLYIDFVCHITGAKRVVLLGYSLGAMEINAYQGVLKDKRVAGIISIAGLSRLQSQPTIKKLRTYNVGAGILPATPFDPLRYLGGIFPWLTRNLLAKIPLRVMRWLPILKDLYDFEHMEERGKEGITLVKTFSYATEAITPGMLEQLVEVMAIDPRGFVSMDRRTDYLGAMEGITVPYLAVCGETDTLASPENVRLGFDRVRTPAGRKRMRVIVNTGHLDLLLRESSMRQVAAQCMEFMREFGRVT